MSLSGTTIQWRGLTLQGGAPGDYLITSFSGWTERPESRGGGDQRPMAHGRFDAPFWSDERVVTVGGKFHSATNRDVLLDALDAAMLLSDGATTEPLVVTHAGHTLTADARLTRFAANVDAGWGVGYVPFAIEWRCPDPRRYGDPVNATTGFQTSSGGLQFDLFTNGTSDVGYLDFGTAGASGRVSLTNPGPMDSPPQFQVTGPTPPFWIVNIETGRRLYFSRALSSAETLLIDSATGVVTLNGGDVDYSGLLTTAEWFSVPRLSGACTIAFLPDGSWSTGQMLAIVRPAWG